MNTQEAYRWLVEHNREIAYIGSMKSLLAWDQRTYIPSGGHPHRSAQIGVLARLIHIRMTDPKMGDMLSAVEGSDLMADSLSVEAVNVREWRRDFDRATKIPEDFAVALAQAEAEGETAWQSARPANDWQGFRPYLENLVRLKREEAAMLKPTGELYNALLDDFEPGATAEEIEPLFKQLRKATVSLLDRIAGSSRHADTSVLHRYYPTSVQKSFSWDVVKMLGYNTDCGRLDASAHPFTVGIGPGDVRITSRYDENCFNMAFFSTVHEAGHAIYDQGLPTEYWGTPRGRAVSLGIHESQSRMWENLVGRSFGFWKYFYPEAQKRFDALKDVRVETFHFAVNDVRPGLIRTESDEVTYNLHIMLRFELELDLMRDNIEVDDLPGAWNARMKSYLGLEPPDYAQGVMQDIHWSGGAIGYFPTYTLGNLYAAQFFAQAERDLASLEDLFSEGKFQPFLEWLRSKIHSQGSRYLPRELVRTVTGEDLSPKYLINHLEKKFGYLYGF